MKNAAVALASLLVLSMSCTPTPEDWGQASSAYVERCEGEACAQGNECAGGYCLKPEDAGDDYRPGLRCGDGLVQRWEDCDDGNDINTDNCLTGCRAARCGDGFVRAHLTIHDPEYEACDDGNLDDTDGCTSECRLARCGDGFVRADLEPGEDGYEACDDGNRFTRDACVDCVPARCGDGLVHDGVETCDDGNEELDDGCVADCQSARCGDGHLRADVEPGGVGYELCDDGNQDPEDACGNDCYPNALPQGLGSGPDDLAHSCGQILAANPQAGDGLYWVDVDGARPTPPAQVRCDMRTDGGGFTRMILLHQDLALWNAWTDGLIGQPEGDDPFGIPLNSMQKPSAELEVYFRRNGERVTPILSGVSASVWNPIDRIEEAAGALISRAPGAVASECSEPILRAADHWNWSFASASGCAAPGAGGVVVYGDPENDLGDAAVRFQGPAMESAEPFESLEVWVR